MSEVPDDTAGLERWFLRRGMPAALPARARRRGVLPRSAPALAGWATLMVCSTLVTIGSGGQEINIEDDPTAVQWVTLAVFFLIPPAMVAAAWAVSRVASLPARTVIAMVAIVVGVLADWYDDGPFDAARDLLTDAALVALILAATGIGIGSILAWSVRIMLSHLRSVGRLMSRVLPVVLLTVLVFFNATVWSVAASLDTVRLWLLVGFMGLIAGAFLVTGLLDSITATVDAEADAPDLSHGERTNILLLLVVSQFVQVSMLAVITGTVFFVLGLIVLNPTVLSKLTGGAPAQSEWFDITLPVSAAHVHITIFLTALTFMYISARAVGDGEYRSAFLDPLLEDVRLVVAARNRYRDPDLPTAG
jgi:hypothetical protein